MKTKLFTLLLAVAASVGTMFAWDYERVQIGDLYYNLDAASQTAEVTSQNSSYPYWSTTITTANIPASVIYNDVTYSVTSIGNNAFENCTGLTGELVIPNSVTSIGSSAFMYCTGLTSVTIPNSVTSIGNQAFDYVPNIVYNGTATGSPWGARSINGFVDGYCVYSDATKTVLLGCSSKAIGEIVIPNSVTSIGDNAFYECSGLTSVTIPNSVTSIGNNAFENCTGLTGELVIPNSVTSISSGAFMYCTGLTSVTIPNSVISIGGAAFSGCESLTSVTIGNSVTSIEDYAFMYCTDLTSVTIGNSVTSIGSSAFYGCTGLTSVTIPNSVTSIEEYAFYYCGLTSVTIPNSVTSIGSFAFYECRGLTSIDVASDNSNYCSEDGVLFNKDKTTLIQYPGGKQGAYTMIPNSVTSIGESAFASCTGLTSIEIPNSVTSIGDYAFYYCSGLTFITIPNSVTSIGNDAFACCYGLTSVTNFANTPQEIGSYIFDNVDKSTCVLYVPAGSISAYKSANQWKDFSKILPIEAQPADVTTTTVTPSETTADIAWPQVTGAATYTIEIKKNGELICTLIFNAQGQLISIAFAAPSRNNAPQQAQAAGFSFTITGLESGTTYSYTMKAKGNNGNVLKTESGTFTTTGESQGIEEVSSSLQGGDRGRLILHNGQIFILRGEKVYTLTGQEVR